MTDPVREAFEKWAADGKNLGGMEREFAWAAWQQSRREALLEAVNVCEDKGDQFAILFGEPAQQRGYDCAKAIIELISAAAIRRMMP